MKSSGILLLIFTIILIVIGMSMMFPYPVMVYQRPRMLNQYNLPIHLGGRRRISRHGSWRYPYSTPHPIRGSFRRPRL